MQRKSITIQIFIYNESMGRKRKEVNSDSFTGRFATRLRTLREAKGLTIEQLSEKSGIPAGTLYAWENARLLPSLDRLPILADALGIPLRIILPEK